MGVRAVLMVLVLALSPGLALAQGSVGVERTPSEMGFEELLARLPAAENEVVYSPQVSDWVEAPSSVELRRRLLRCELSGEQIARAFTKAGVIKTHRKWPKDRPYAIAVTYPRWLGHSGIFRVHPVLPGAAAIHVDSLAHSCFLGVQGDRERRAYMEIGPVPTGANLMGFTIETFARQYDPSEGAEIFSHHSFELWLPVEIVEDESAALDEDPLPQVEDLVRKAWSFGFVPPSVSERTWSLWLSAQTWELRDRLPNQSGLHAEITILDDERVLGRGTITFATDCYLPWGNTVYVTDFPANVVLVPALLARVRVQVKGLDAKTAFRDLRHEVRWTGSFEFPLQAIIKH